MRVHSGCWWLPEGASQKIVVHGWAGQVPQVTACSQEDNLDIQGLGIGRVTHVVAVTKQTTKEPRQMKVVARGATRL
jgi:hypothetical protein